MCDIEKELETRNIEKELKELETRIINLERRRPIESSFSSPCLENRQFFSMSSERSTIDWDYVKQRMVTMGFWLAILIAGGTITFLLFR